MVPGNQTLITKGLKLIWEIQVHDFNYSNVPDDEYYYGYDYLRVCTLGTKDLPGFYKDHWLIDSGAFDHLISYLEDFSNLAQGEHSTATGSIIKMCPWLVIFYI